MVLKEFIQETNVKEFIEEFCVCWPFINIKSFCPPRRGVCPKHGNGQLGYSESSAVSAASTFFQKQYYTIYMEIFGTVSVDIIHE
jgi:hypothetical protein